MRRCCSNGTTPDYFVGHVDEFNYDWIWHQNLLLPPGTHHITVTRKGRPFGPAMSLSSRTRKSSSIYRKERHAEDGRLEPRRETDRILPRFKAGTASATSRSRPSPEAFSGSPTRHQLRTVLDADLADRRKPSTPTSAESAPWPPAAPRPFRRTRPRPTISTRLALAEPSRARDGKRQHDSGREPFREPGRASLPQDRRQSAYAGFLDADLADLERGQRLHRLRSARWIPAAAKRVKAEPEGHLAGSRRPAGSHDRRNEQLHSERDERLRRQCHANRCASHHRHGRADSDRHLAEHLLSHGLSGQEEPASRTGEEPAAFARDLAAGFKKYLEYDPDAKLSVEAYADIRGSKQFNQDLSERRVERIKQYLVDQGISADKVQTAAYGKDRPLPKDQVAQLEGIEPAGSARSRASATSTAIG